MPRLNHEALVQIVRNAPELIARLVCPEDQVAVTPVRVTSAEFVDLNLAEYRSDGVLLLGADPERPVRVLIAEAQVSIDPRKLWTWPAYAICARARWRCPASLVVLAFDPEVAAWARQPIDLGDGEFRPRVIDSACIPVITDIDQARAAPELAVLSVAAHADEPGAEHIALAALAAAHDLDNERGVVYPDFILALLGEVTRKKLEQLMQSGRYEFQSDFARKYFAEGKAEGEAKGRAEVLLQLLKLKNFAVPEATRAQILECRDLEQIEEWVSRVLTARTLEDVLEG